MKSERRKWWRNCYGYRNEKWPEDPEVEAIDELEDKLGTLDAETIKIRKLIGRLEMCHHKAQRHIEILIEAIGKGKTDKEPGKRPLGSIHPREAFTELVIGCLTAWVKDEHYDVPPFGIGGMSMEDLFGFLGEKTPLKLWQVQRVCDKLHSFLDPDYNYYTMVEHPERYAEQAHYRGATINTVIADKIDEEPAQLTLASAIDHLESCNWNFPENLVIVLRAIGGDLKPHTPYAAHSRNVSQNPIREFVMTVSTSLDAFCTGNKSRAVRSDILEILGKKTPVKEWLAASLEKTIRLQIVCRWDFDA